MAASRTESVRTVCQLTGTDDIVEPDENEVGMDESPKWVIVPDSSISFNLFSVLFASFARLFLLEVIPFPCSSIPFVFGRTFSNGEKDPDLVCPVAGLGEPVVMDEEGAARRSASTV